MKGSIYIMQVLSIHLSMDMAKYHVTILLCYHVTKLLKHRKGMEGIKQEQWIHQKRKARYRMDQNTMYILPIWNER